MRSTEAALNVERTDKHAFRTQLQVCTTEREALSIQVATMKHEIQALQHLFRQIPNANP